VQKADKETVWMMFQPLKYGEVEIEDEGNDAGPSSDHNCGDDAEAGEDDDD
jgi:hypothetical protein